MHGGGYMKRTLKEWVEKILNDFNTFIGVLLVLALMPDIFKSTTHKLVYIFPCFFVWVEK